MGIRFNSPNSPCLHFFTFIISSFLNLYISSFLSFSISSFLRFFVSSFLHFFISSFSISSFQSVQDSNNLKLQKKIPKILSRKSYVPKKIMLFLEFKSNSVYSNVQTRVPRGSKNPKIMKIEVFATLIRQIWIWPVPRDAEQCHLQHTFIKNAQRMLGIKKRFPCLLIGFMVGLLVALLAGFDWQD